MRRKPHVRFGGGRRKSAPCSRVTRRRPYPTLLDALPPSLPVLPGDPDRVRALRRAPLDRALRLRRAHHRPRRPPSRSRTDAPAAASATQGRARAPGARIRRALPAHRQPRLPALPAVRTSRHPCGLGVLQCVDEDPPKRRAPWAPRGKLLACEVVVTQFHAIEDAPVSIH